MKKADNDGRAYALVSFAETYDKANATDKMVQKLSAKSDISKLKLCSSVVKSTAQTAVETTYDNDNTAQFASGTLVGGKD